MIWLKLSLVISALTTLLVTGGVINLEKATISKGTTTIRYDTAICDATG